MPPPSRQDCAVHDVLSAPLPLQNAAIAKSLSSFGISVAPIAHLELVNLGSAPPRVGGARVLRTYAGITPLELSLSWGSNAHFRAVLGYQIAGRAFRLPVDVRNIAFSGVVRTHIR